MSKEMITKILVTTIALVVAQLFVLPLFAGFFAKKSENAETLAE